MTTLSTINSFNPAFGGYSSTSALTELGPPPSFQNIISTCNPGGNSTTIIQNFCGPCCPPNPQMLMQQFMQCMTQMMQLFMMAMGFSGSASASMAGNGFSASSSMAGPGSTATSSASSYGQPSLIQNTSIYT